MDAQETDANIELRSDEVQEIMGHIPSRIIRYGIAVIFAVVIVLFIGSFFFKYPDIIIADVELITVNPPAEVWAKSNGNLTHIFVEDSSVVLAGSDLAVIQNPANLHHIQQVKPLLANLEVALLQDTFSAQFPDTLQLGDIQAYYLNLLKNLQQKTQFINQAYHEKKIKSLKLNADEFYGFGLLLSKQITLYKEELHLEQSKYRRDSMLYIKDVISLADYEESQKRLLQVEMVVQQKLSDKISNNIKQEELAQEILEYELAYGKELEDLNQDIRESIQQLESQLAWWTDKYLLQAPINGRVVFNRIWSSNQYVASGEQVFSIVPQAERDIIGKVLLDARGAGKVKLGQKVNIKFNNFPYQEFGMINARVSTMAAMPLNKTYALELELPDTLITNYGRELPFTQKMSGKAEIITADLPLIARIFNPIKSLFMERWSGA